LDYFRAVHHLLELQRALAVRALLLFFDQPLLYADLAAQLGAERAEVGGPDPAAANVTEEELIEPAFLLGLREDRGVFVIQVDAHEFV
jgi:hypothetical protein